METIIYKLLEFGLYFCIFFLFYKAVLKDSCNHGFNRFYLNSTALLAMIIPFINFPTYSNTEIFSIILNPIEIGSSTANELIQAGNESFPLIALLGGLYVLFSALILLKVIFGFTKILKIKGEGQLAQLQHYQIIISEKVVVPFSFFETVYLPANDYPDNEKKMILDHELCHIKYGHSFDKVLMLVAKVLFWWHPFIHSYFEELELIHEFQVDADMTINQAKKSYSQFLLSFAQQQTPFQFANNISSHIKKRILMLNNENKSTPWMIRWGSYTLLVVAILFMHSCTKEEDDKDILDRSYSIKKEKDDGAYEVISVTDTVTVFDYDTKEESVRIVQTDHKVYKKPDVMPVFPGCDDISGHDELYECSNQKLLQFIYKNIKYPKEDKESGLEGMAVAQFVIGENGSIHSEKVVRSLSPGTDKTIMAMFQLMRESGIQWTAGRNDGEEVSTLFTLPVKFKLEG